MRADHGRPFTALLSQTDQLELREQRHWLHRCPELAFNEFETADRVCQELKRLGLHPHRGLAQTGVVATVEGTRSGPAVGLRADMDALPIRELTGLPYASVHEGRMHACGHDGHTAMLLGAARLLVRDRDFAGRVHLVFQPAEENEGGGRVMVEDGLFDRYPMQAIFALHNWPGLGEGTVAVMPGPMMASYDVFTIELSGAGGHAAMPHRADDVIVAGASLTLALQTVVSRRLDPADCGVLSITQVEAGSAWNVLSDTYCVRGCCRALSSRTQQLFEKAMREIVRGVSSAYNLAANVSYERRLPAIVNDPASAALVAECARQTLGADRVMTNLRPSLAGEDFSFMLQRCPGAYFWLGIGEDSPPLHSTRYDFNDAVLADGARLLASVAHTALARLLQTKLVDDHGAQDDSGKR
jgi:amidohydrolase